MARCPSCGTFLTRVEERGIRMATCSNCFGTWMDEGALMRRVRGEVAERNSAGKGGETRATAEGNSIGEEGNATLKELAEVVEASDSRGELRCAQCEKVMEKGKFHPMIPVRVDRCRGCGYLWMDAGEMRLVARLFVELMTSEDPEIVRRRDKIGGLAVQWQARREALREGQEGLYAGGNWSDGAGLIPPRELVNVLEAFWRGI